MAIEVGDKAPDFHLRDSNRGEVSLADFHGRKNVVLVFYPWAFTRVCTGELCAIRDELPSLQNDEVAVLTVSCDAPPTLRAFAEAQGFSHPLLSDFWPHGETARAYGVFDENLGAAVRGTFVIDREGVVRWKVVNAVPDARDLGDYQRVLAGL